MCPESEHQSNSPWNIADDFEDLENVWSKEGGKVYPERKRTIV